MLLNLSILSFMSLSLTVCACQYTLDYCSNHVFIYLLGILIDDTSFSVLILLSFESDEELSSNSDSLFCLFFMYVVSFRKTVRVFNVL